jgi:hypothetical protein
VRYGQYPDTLEDQRARTAQEQPDRGPAENQPTLPGTSSPSEGQRVQLPPVNFPPAGMFAVDQQQDADIAAGATATVLTLNVPINNQLRIDGIGFGADDEVALRFLTWTLFIRSDPAQAYSNVGASIGTIVETSTIILHARGPNTITLVLSSSAAAVLTYRFVVRLKGWMFTDVRMGPI